MSSLLKSPLPRLMKPGTPLVVGQAVHIAGPDHHYLTRVLRLAVGDPLLLLDGQGRVAQACITGLGGEVLSVEPQRIEQASGAGLPELWLLVGMLKGEKHDLVIQKATELGAAAIVSVACQRSIPALSGERADKRQLRWGRVAAAAAQQCRRPGVPRISPPLSLTVALAELPAGPRFQLSEGVAPPLRTLLAPVSDGESSGQAQTLSEASRMSTSPGSGAVALLVGPEGGLTDEEIELAGAAGFVPCSIGPHILRAETAAIAALAAATALLMQ